jgi:PAS domain-containing protein
VSFGGSDVESIRRLYEVHTVHYRGEGCSELPGSRLPRDHSIIMYVCWQYMNRSSERFLGFSRKDVAGKSLLETNSVDNKELMVQQLQRGREWEGLISWRRKMGDPVVLSGRVIPFCSIPGR